MIQGTVVLSEKGACRQNNQDAVLALSLADEGIFAVADGMGGHFRGDLASRTAVSLLETWWEDRKGSLCLLPFLNIVDDLEKRVREVNREIFRMYRDFGQSGGTTLCLLLICGNAYIVLNIGDSRLYRCKDQSCMQMTMDDVWENQSFIRKRTVTEDVRKDPRYGRLVQALGSDEEVKLSISTGRIEQKTCFFLCSDGVYRYCEDQWFLSQLEQIKEKEDMKAAAETMKKMVYQNGAKDNLSMIFVMAEGEDGTIWQD